MTSSDELMHYGVLGMRWGHRKKRQKSGKVKIPSYIKKQQYKDKFKRDAVGVVASTGVQIAAGSALAAAVLVGGTPAIMATGIVAPYVATGASLAKGLFYTKAAYDAAQYGRHSLKARKEVKNARV